MSGHLTNQSSHFLTTFPSSDCPLRLKAWTSQSMSSGKALGTLRRLTYIALFHVQSQEYSEYSFYLAGTCIYRHAQLMHLYKCSCAGLGCRMQSNVPKIKVAHVQNNNFSTCILKSTNLHFYDQFQLLKRDLISKIEMEALGFEPSTLSMGTSNWLSR